MVVWEKSRVSCKVEVSGLCGGGSDTGTGHKQVTERQHREEESWLWYWWKDQSSPHFSDLR